MTGKGHLGGKTLHTEKNMFRSATEVTTNSFHVEGSYYLVD